MSAVCGQREHAPADGVTVAAQHCARERPREQALPPQLDRGRGCQLQGLLRRQQRLVQSEPLRVFCSLQQLDSRLKTCTE